MTIITKKNFSLLAVSAIALMTSPAFAKDYDSVEKLDLSDFIANVKIIESKGAATTVVVTPGSEGQEITVSENDGVLMITGPGRPDYKDYKKNWNYIKSNGKVIRDDFGTLMATFPTITITTPGQTDLQMTDVMTILNSDDLGDVFVDDLVKIRATFGNIETGDITLSGSGDMTFGNVNGPLDANVNGSGDLSFGDIAEGILEVRGSGDLLVGNVAGDVRADVRGSGDLEMEDVSGAATFKVQGSGDLAADSLMQKSILSVNGSGDIHIGRLKDAPIQATVNGSGDIQIDEGSASALKVRVNGAGDMVFNGTATNPDVATSSRAASIRIKDYKGTPKISGKGDIRVGNLRGED